MTNIPPPNKTPSGIELFFKTLIGKSFVLWLTIAELLMFFLSSSKEIYPLIALADFFSFYIKPLDSLKYIKVFDNKIAWMHYAFMLAISLPLAAVFAFIKVDSLEKNPIIGRVSWLKKTWLTIFAILFCWVSLSLEFYTGFYSFSLSSTPYGFAALSAIQSYSIPLFSRFLKVVFNYKG